MTERLARWTVHLLFASVLTATAALAVWMVVLTHAILLRAAGSILVVVIAGAALAKMRGR